MPRLMYCGRVRHVIGMLRDVNTFSVFAELFYTYREKKATRLSHMDRIWQTVGSLVGQHYTA